LTAKAQFLPLKPTIVLDTATQLKVGIMADAFVNSDALTARAVNGLVQGGYITRDERQNMLNRADAYNVEGSRGYGSLFYAQRIDSLFGKPSHGINLFIQAKHRIDNYASFSTNALQLALFGNKPFAGNTAQFAPLDYTELQYQQLQVGWAKNMDNKFSYYVGASVLLGQNARMLNTYKLGMYTSPTGDTIDIDARADLYQSNPSNQSFLGNNGIGAALDVGITMPFQLFNDSLEESYLEVAISDIGFIQWYSTAQHQKADTSTSYYGTHFTNIFDPAAPIFYQDPGVLVDSLTTTQNKAFTTALPATVTARLKHTHQKWEYYIQGTFRNQAYYKPFFAASATRQLNTQWKLGAQLNTGGYGVFGGGVYTQYTSNHFDVLFGSHQLEGFLFPNKTAGQQLFLLFSYRI
jgi:hypothetical protein